MDMTFEYLGATISVSKAFIKDRVFIEVWSPGEPVPYTTTMFVVPGTPNFSVKEKVKQLVSPHI